MICFGHKCIPTFRPIMSLFASYAPFFICSHVGAGRARDILETITDFTSAGMARSYTISPHR